MAMASPRGGTMSDESSNSLDNSPEIIPQEAVDTSLQSALPPPSAPVPDVLLSLAKDDRYTSQITALLAQTIVSFASVLFPLRHRRNRSDESFDTNEIIQEDGQRFIERIQPELQLLSSIIVHSATFVYFSRQFRDSSTSANEGATKRSIGMESLNLAYSFPRKRDLRKRRDLLLAGHEKTSGIAARMKGTLHRAMSSVMIDRWQSLLLLQTLFPYAISRAGRGGWSKDLGGVMTACLECLGFQSSRRLDERSNNAAADDVFRNDDRLRGSARRRLFEEQRRRMMSSANSAEAETVRDEVTRSGHDLPVATLSDTTNYNLLFRAKRVARCSWDFLRRVSLALSSLPQGAHTLARQGGPPIDSRSFDRYTKIIKWLLRLHLALFYWNGMYPTVYHRLVGAQIRDNISPFNPLMNTSPNDGVIVANRPTYKPIAVLILLQALTALVQSAAEASIEIVHKLQIAYFRWRRTRNRYFDERVNNQCIGRDGSEREAYLDLVEQRVPSASSATDVQLKQQQTKSKGQSIHPCGICLNERINPAASSVCGHVFCWNCILHWVSNIRAECPLCRAPTRPQDILPLYNHC